MKADIPALPIHDSILTQDRHQSRVAEFMEASYASRYPGVTPCKIKLSRATVPHMGGAAPPIPALLTFSLGLRSISAELEVKNARRRFARSRNPSLGSAG